jgi:hypothetical protein
MDLESFKMVRPEPPWTNLNVEASRFWTEDTVGENKVWAAGHIVEFDGSPAGGASAYPHATEDVIVSTWPAKLVDKLSDSNLVAAVAPTVSSSLRKAFDAGLIRAPSMKAYVTEGFAGRSLGALQVSGNQVTFFLENRDDGKIKLRARVADGHFLYDLSSPALASRRLLDQAGIAALRATVLASKMVHLRVGLARAFPHNQCYAQINGMYIV